MRIGVIIQARMGSSRLPKKVLMDLEEKNILEYVIDRCKKINHITEIIVATSTEQRDNLIEDWCKLHKIKVFRGSENNVLSRYIECAKLYNLNWIVRVTSDCPFLDYETANEVIEAAIQDKDFDLWAIKENWTRGLAIELITIDALKRINEYTQEDLYQEHVTLLAYRDSRFRKKDFYVSKSIRFPQYRLTVDTVEDYKVVSEIANYFRDSEVSCKRIFEFLNENPSLATYNSNIKQEIISGNN